jgi:hypothetical protein
VSGSGHRKAIVWDLSRSTFIRQSTGHNAPLAANDINDLTGDIATCTGTWLHLWSIYKRRTGQRHHPGERDWPQVI